MFSYRASIDSRSGSPAGLKAPLFAADDLAVSLQSHKRQHRRFKQILAGQWAIIVVLVCSIIFMSVSQRTNEHYWIKDELYSPARDAVRYETVVFDPGIGSGRTKYQGFPAEENNKAWEDLYQAGTSIIPIEEAAKLPVPSRPHEKSPGYYTIQLDVFHQLHCLNRIRMGLWARDIALLERDNAQTIAHFNETSMSMEHLSHCIDAIRQSLMCSADISPISWHWIEEYRLLRPIENSTHTCRDFGAIQQWARDRQALAWNESVFVSDPLRAEWLHVLCQSTVAT